VLIEALARVVETKRRTTSARRDVKSKSREALKACSPKTSRTEH
jgi:hypothetical protein